jgi:mono/diheme cytochrome c family protein
MSRPVFLLLLATALTWADPFSDSVKPFLRTHCSGCHSGKTPAGAFAVSELLTPSAPESLRARDRWERVAQRITTGEMPPKDSPRPPAAKAKEITTWVATAYAELDRKTPIDPGRVTARRLNRFEYSNSVRDLLGLDLNPGEDFPVDPYGYGFDNIGDVLSMNAGMTEQYLKAAERIAKSAVPIPGETIPATMQRYLAERVGQDRQLRLHIDHVFPVEGDYTLRTAFYQAMKDGTRVRIRLFLDGKEVGTEELRFYYQIDRAAEAKAVHVPAGRHRVEASIEVLPDPPYKGTPPYLEYLQVYGPIAGSAKPNNRFFTCIDATPACARQILAPLARKAFRRPVTGAEMDGLLSLAATEQNRTGSFPEAMRTSLMAILMSPHFLFRIERDRGPGSQLLDPHELATRLSYFLWGSLPDVELSKVTDVRRMLKDPRSAAFIESFAGQWLQTRNLSVLKPDPTLFPQFTGELAAAMRTETELFFAAIVREDRSILDFIDGPFTYVNGPLAKHYGIPGITGDAFQRVALDGVQRGGVLSHASVLTVSSYPTRTSPVIRGKWVLENILNQPPPAPPPDVPGLDEKAAASGGSMRQQMERHRTSATCAGCHSRMDPLGFGLENYDAIGRWREVDASGELPGGVRFGTPAEMKQILKADPEVFTRALTEKVLTYALGRGLELRDRATVKKIADRVRANGYRFSALIEGVVESDPFRRRRAEGAAQ